MNKQELRKDLELTLAQLETVYDDLDNKMQLLEKSIETIMTLKSELNATSVSKKQATKAVSSKNVSVKKAVKPAVKTAVKATKTASVRPKTTKSWNKFSLDNLPKAYTFLKVSFKDDTKAQFGRFLHTSITKDKHIFIDLVDNKKNTIRIPFQNIKQVYEYR